MAESVAHVDAGRLRIGEWEVEPRRNLISRAGSSVRLEPKVVELLVALARRPGEVVGREELLQSVWPGVVVGDDTLTQAINKLRKSLGDDVHTPKYIETISKRGYRLIAPTAAGQGRGAAVAPASAQVRRRRWLWLTGITMLAVAAAVLTMLGDPRWLMRGDDAPGAKDPVPIIAVLPLANQSGEPGRDYFSDGVTEDIISALGRFSALRVISRTSVEQYKSQPSSAQSIGSMLGARYIVHGSVREADGKLRVAVELSDAERGIVLWTERFEGKHGDIFFIQDQIVKKIVGSLAVKVSQLERERTALKPVASLEAYDLVLRARPPLISRNRAANRQARGMLSRALQLAPDYAEAHVLLAVAEILQIELGWIEYPEEALTAVENRLLHALALDDPGTNARAHAFLGYVHSMRGDFDQALIEVDRALELNPSDALALRARGSALTYMGRIDDALDALETARQYDPAVDIAHRAVAYYAARRYPEALAAANFALMKHPRLSLLHAIRAAALAQMGQQNAAREAAAHLMQLEPVFPVRQFGSRFRDPKHAAHLQDGLRKAGL